MDQTQPIEGGGRTCLTEGCNRPSKAKTKPGLCNACMAREHYHRKNPDAPRKPIGSHGRWIGKLCECGQPVHCKGLCAACYRKQYTPPKQTPEQNRARRIKHRYGITSAQYERMVEERKNKCDVCGEGPSAKNTRAHWGGKLCIDHDHATGKIRGLLCNDCNLAVGYGKTPSVLESAARYLRLHYGSDS